MRTLLIILFSLFHTFAFSQNNGWWYGNGSSAAPAGPDTLTLTYWDDFILLHIANTGITEDANGVSQWQDRSGNGNHSTQTNNSNKPSTDIDGNVVFNGTSDYLIMSDNAMGPDFTMFLVGTRTDTTGGSYFIEYNDNTPAMFINSTWGKVTTQQQYRINFTYADTPTPTGTALDTFNLNDYALLSVAAQVTDSIQAYVNSTLKLSDPLDGSWNNFGTFNAKLGSERFASGGTFFGGKILFIGIADRKFTPAEIATTESELNSFFTIY